MLFAAKRPLTCLLLKCQPFPIRWLRGGSGTSLSNLKRNGSIVRTSSSARRYTPEEDVKIVKGYNDGRSWQEIAASINKSAVAIETRFRDHMDPRRGSARWSAADDDLLLESRRKGEAFKAISVQLNRTLSAVENRFYRLVPTRARHKYADKDLYTPSEDLALLRLRDQEHRSYRYIGNSLGRPWTSIRGRYQYLSDPQVVPGHVSSHVRIRYTPRDDANILRMKEMENAPFSEIASELGRTSHSVQHRYYRYLRTERRIRPKGKPSFWTDAEDRRLIELRIAGYTFKEVAKELAPRSCPAVNSRYISLMDKQSRIAGPIRDPSSLVWDSGL